VASTFFVYAFFLPAHLRFEEREVEESFGLVLGMLAVAGAAIVARSLWRAAHTIWLGRRLLQAARRIATRLDDGTLALPGLPGISLAGIVRTNVLIGRDALHALSAAELDVAISHEMAHRRSRDNVKRFLMYCAPDVFGLLGVAQALERKWEAEAECLADSAAVDGDRQRAMLLASALVKVARLTYRGPMIVPPPAWSAFHVPTLLESRIRRLVDGDLPRAPRGRIWLVMALAGSAAPVVVWLADLSYTLHAVTEAMVTRLP
jgi:Zn-dependent protease with chaperone function